MPRLDDYGNWITPDYMENINKGLIAVPPPEVTEAGQESIYQSGGTTPYWQNAPSAAEVPTTASWSPTGPAEPSANYVGLAPETAPTAPAAAAKVVPSWETIQGYLLNSPYYKQGLESIGASYDLRTKYAADQLGFANAAWERQRQRAAHDLPLQRKAIREGAAGRGTLRSGQTAFDIGRADYTYNNLLEDIAAAQRERQSTETYNQTTLERNVADQRYKLLTDTAAYYKDLWWDPETGVYRGPS